MSHSVVIESANFTKFVDQRVPHLALAKGYWLFGGNFNTSKVNLAPGGGPDLVANGTGITYGENYVQFTEVGGYFFTGLSFAGDHTILTIHTPARASPASTDVMVSVGAFNRLASIYGVQYRAGGGYGGTVIAAHAPGANYGFMASTMPSDTSAGKGYGTPTAGTLVETVGDGLGAALPADNVTIGPELIAYGGESVLHRQAAVMAFDTRLSFAQLTDLYNYFRFKMPSRGISVF